MQISTPSFVMLRRGLFRVPRASPWPARSVGLRFLSQTPGFATGGAGEADGAASRTTAGAANRAATGAAAGGSGSGGRRWRRGTKRVTFVAASVVGAVAAYNLSDNVQTGVDFVALATKRTVTVSYTVIRCAWDYRRTLNAVYPNEEARQEALKACHLRCAKRARWACEVNAGLFIKTGQHIAALTYIFPDEWTSTMMPLQDQCPITPFEDVKALILEDEGHPVEELFLEFSEEPMGTASLAQVHRAKLKSGQDVAVKVQHPTLRRFIPLDIMLIQSVIGAVEWLFPQYPMSWLADEIESSIYTELDFREEAKNATLTREYFQPFYDQTALRVPKVFWARKRLLCMEFVTGGRPDDLEFLEKHNISRGELSACFAHLFSNMIFTPGVGLHCDPHAGNIAIRPLRADEELGSHNFEVVLYDHGLYRWVPTDTRRAYAHLWLALLDNDEPGMRKYAYEFAGIGPDEFNLFAAAITGRDTENAVGNVASKRELAECESMARSVTEDGLLGDIMQMLRKMPRIVLLVLKTNDLTRYLDEKLDSPLGVVRGFLIMAQYCARTVFEERREAIAVQFGSSWSPRRWWAEAKNWWMYFKRENELWLYDWWAYLGLATIP